MNRNEIFEAITAERARQDEKHPVAFICLLHEKDPSIETLKKHLVEIQEVNRKRKEAGQESAFGNALEELIEFFVAETKENRIEEAIQNCSYWERITEEITKCE